MWISQNSFYIYLSIFSSYIYKLSETFNTKKMCSSSYGIISSPRSDPSCFPILPHTTSDPFLFSSFKTHLPKPRVSLRTRVGSFRLRAVRSERSVSSPSAMSFYELLGIPETGTLLDIKQAYKQLARKYHPDVSPPGLVQEYTERFIRVQEAYEILSDPGRRALYDDDMAKGLHFAFSARKSYQNNEMEDRREWKNRWQAQLSELKRRNMYKEDKGNMSWAERVRLQRKESAS